MTRLGEFLAFQSNVYFGSFMNYTVPRSLLGAALCISTEKYVGINYDKNGLGYYIHIGQHFQKPIWLG
jgi:hypothetical protein